ncbi:MAG: ATP-binding protein [Candidatus Hydrogenedentales bacterium]|jgi:PAS domain S-box-containing protein
MAIALKRENTSPSGIPRWVYGMMLLGAFLEIVRWVVFDGKATFPEADVLVGMLARVFFCAAVVLAVNSVARGQSLRITLTIGVSAIVLGWCLQELGRIDGLAHWYTTVEGEELRTILSRVLSLAGYLCAFVGVFYVFQELYLARRAEETRSEDLIREAQERREILQEVTTRERMLAQAERLARIGSWEWSRAKGTIALSEEMSHLLGADPTENEVPVETILERLDDADFAQIEEQISKAQSGSQFIEWTFRVRHSSGAERILRCNACVMFDDDPDVPARLVGMAQDITELRRAEHSLRENERFLQDIFESILDGISILDSDLRIVRVNSAMERWYAHAMPLQGKKCFQVYHGRDVPCERCPSIHTLATGEPQCETLARWTPEGDSQEWHDLYTFPIRDSETGEIRGVIEYIRDVTDRMRAEEDRRSLETQLQHTQKLESLGVLAGGIAHDFNNLLQGVLGGVSLALLEAPADSPLRGNLETISQAARRAADLVGQMLTYSGRGHFSKQFIALCPVVKEMLKLIESCISKKTRLEYRCQDNLPTVEADVTQLRQIVMNLVTNASESLEEKEGVVSIAIEKRYCDSAFLRDCMIGEALQADDYVCLRVTDTGCGMDSETLAKAFDPFYTTKFAGRGLGLAVVLGIVRGHNGGLHVETSEGKGSTFTVLFPCVDQSARELTDEAPSAAIERASGTVLLVDDEPVVREIAKRALERVGYRVYCAEDGEAGLTLFERHADEIDAVVLDMSMPQMDGRQAYMAIRSRYPNVPIILSSGYSKDDVMEDFGADTLLSFLQKPYLAERLVERVTRCLS